MPRSPRTPLTNPVLQKVFAKIEPKAGDSLVQSGSTVYSPTTGQTYLVKQGPHSEKEHYEAEAESLRLMYAAQPGICPCLLECALDPDSDTMIFVSEYKSLKSLNAAAAGELGRMLASMHTHSSSQAEKFGFSIPTFCGRTRMRNGWTDTWEETFDRKIGDLLDTLRKDGSYNELCAKGDVLRKVAIPKLLKPLKTRPALLHGDLWCDLYNRLIFVMESGNAGVNAETNKPVIFDPCCYYGHNEADLAIARIFGGFAPSFYESYHECIPPSDPVDEYDARAALYKVFHYLNHTVLFGMSYVSSAMREMDIALDVVR
ncbi:fructosamine kinase PKL/CAK/FruK [Phlyctochytrium arcticum]|nr:fructosamine kinase PKL/CAK/FruK [Phlyctochytrium arcticum]